MEHRMFNNVAAALRRKVYCRYCEVAESDVTCVFCDDATESESTASSDTEA